MKKQEPVPNDVDDRVKNGLIKLHSDFLKTGLPSNKFNFTYVENKDSALVSYISNKKISWMNALTMAGLSYDHHRGQMNYGKTRAEIRKTFKFLIAHIVDLSGDDVGVLNDHNMNSTERVTLPKELLVSNDHSLCSELGCEIFTITKRSIYAQGRRLFGDWNNALNFCGIDYEKQVLKKISSRALLDTIIMLNEYDHQKDGKWSFQDIRNEDGVLERALHNAFSKKENVPFAEFSNQKIAVMVANLNYWREKGELKNDVEWWNKNKERLLERYHVKHRSQETWSIGKIQTQALKRYADGGNLSRSELESDSSGKKLLAALRSHRWGKGGGEVGTLKRVGLLTPKLSELQSILDDTPLESVLNQFRTLVAESLEEGENKLSREYVQKHHFELLSAASRWHRRLTKSTVDGINWADILKFFGLNPTTFSISASERSNRGHIFQRYVRDILKKYMIEKSSTDEVLLPQHFCSDKMMSKEVCSHLIRCKPDFFLGDTIIDTKVGGALAKTEQLERYLDHSDRVFVITINDNAKTKKLDNGTVEIISLATFLDRSNEIIGVKIPKDEINGLSQVLKDAVGLSIPPTN